MFLLDVVRRNDARIVCEIGGGANPSIPIEFVRERGLDYLIVDISADELAKAPAGYRTQALDIAKPGAAPRADCDLVFSKMLAEHVRDPVAFHDNCLRLLRPGGMALHFFPTLWAPPFALNLLLPERLGYWILNRVQRGRDKSGNRAKFPAYYHWCRGPSTGQLRRLESAGFEVVQYIGFFGHPGYYRKSAVLLRLHLILASLFRTLRCPYFTSFAFVLLRRPADTSSSA